MNIRVLMVAACPFPVPQGSQVLILETARALKRKSVDVTLLVYGYGYGEITDVPVIRGPCIWGMRKTRAGPSVLKPFADIALRRILHRALRESRFDVIHAHNYEGLWVALAARDRLPIIYHAHNAMVDELPHFMRLKIVARMLGRLLDRTLPHRADQVIALHQPLAEYLLHVGCLPEHISIIPPPCDTTLFPQRTENHDVADEPFVLYTGNLDAYQNLDLLARAMNRVRATIPSARLHIATSSLDPIPWADEIHHTPDLPALIPIIAQDCVVVCPRVSWSGYPIKLLNAMAAGRSIVACKSSAYPLRHGENGFVVPDNDTAAFADAIIALLTHTALRRRLGEKARVTLEQHHSPEAYANELIRLYTRLTAITRGA